MCVSKGRIIGPKFKIAKKLLKSNSFILVISYRDKYLERFILKKNSLLLWEPEDGQLQKLENYINTPKKKSGKNKYCKMFPVMLPRIAMLNVFVFKKSIGNQVEGVLIATNIH